MSEQTNINCQIINIRAQIELLERRIAELEAKEQRNYMSMTGSVLVGYRPTPEPRYDEVYFEGTRWLDENG